MHNNSVANIFKTIRKSVYSPSFYSEPARLAPGPAFSYFFKFILIVALLEAVILCAWIGPQLVGALSSESLGRLVAYYPSDLTVTLKAGKASTNAKEPYYVPMPMDSSKPSGSDYKNLVVIDTAAPSPLDAYRSYGTTVLVTKDYIVSEKGKGQLSVVQLASLPDMTLNRTAIQGFVNQAAPFLKLALPILFLLLFVGFTVGMAISNLFFLLIASLIAWAASAMLKSGLTYRNCYALGLYALTGPIILELILSLFSGRAPWYVGAALFFISYFINTKKHYVLVKTA